MTTQPDYDEYGPEGTETALAFAKDLAHGYRHAADQGLVSMTSPGVGHNPEHLGQFLITRADGSRFWVTVEDA